MADEKQFKRWFKSIVPNDTVFTLIETATGIGIPDVYTCYQGINTWIECKDIPTSDTAIKLRATQYMWLKKLVIAGGRGGLLIRNKTTINYYNAQDISALNMADIKKSGKDYILTGLVKPQYTVTRDMKGDYRSKRKKFVVNVLRGERTLVMKARKGDD